MFLFSTCRLRVSRIWPTVDKKLRVFTSLTPFTESTTSHIPILRRRTQLTTIPTVTLQHSADRRVKKISLTHSRVEPLLPSINTTPTMTTTDTIQSHSQSIPFTLEGAIGLFANQEEWNQSHASSAVPSSSSLNNAPPSPSYDSDPDPSLFSASMDVFARMEAQMRAKKAKSEASSTESAHTLTPATSSSASSSSSPSASSSPSPSSASSQSWSLNFPQLRPIEPKDGQCCGRDCPNCVWIQYAQNLAEWEEQEKRLGRDISIEFTPTVFSAPSQEASTTSSQVTPSPSSSFSSSSSSSSVGSPSRFDLAMQKERDMLRTILPSGPGNKRVLGAILTPHSKEKEEEMK